MVKTDLKLNRGGRLPSYDIKTYLNKQLGMEARSRFRDQWSIIEMSEINLWIYGNLTDDNSGISKTREKDWLSLSLSLIFSFLAVWQWGLWYLSSLTWDGIWIPAMKVPIPNLWTAREVPELPFQINGVGDFPDGSVAKTPHSQCRGPWMGN